MSPAFDPIIRLALALSSSRGAYAVLLGSGISVAAGLPTGRQIITDLVTKIAALHDAVVGEDPLDWYRTRFGEEPDYSKLLDQLASSPAERSELLRRYFEPASGRPQRGPLVPSAAHRALAQLAARGYVSVFLTTNFDRLLEQALEATGVAPTVLSTPDALEGTVPLARTRCTVVKVNGDYLDIRIKNTPAELASYHPAVDRLLDRILDEYGLIVCGWSADWDTALRSAVERNASRRYSTFWTSRNPPTGLAARLVEQRGAEVILIKDADSFFSELTAKLSALDKNARTPTEEAGAASGRTLGRLPARAAPFIGRRTELKEVEKRLKGDKVRLLTLVGPGGTGKTSLAVEAAGQIASDFPDGVAFVDLSGARNAQDVQVAIMRTLGLGEVKGRPPNDVIIDELRQNRMLLVLDNFEQVIEAAYLVAELLSGCPGLCLLVTSREALNIRAEHLYPVQPLAVPSPELGQVSARQLERYEAAQLFVDRAQAVRPDFRLMDGNAPIVAEICRRLDGLPLAIELAAARLRLFPLEALREQLHERLKHLRSGPRDLPERQRTLRATMDWSYDLLKPWEQRLLELLSVFAGADIAALKWIAAEVLTPDGAGWDVAEGLAGLVEKSLVFQADHPSGAPRFAMLETIREYAGDRLGQHTGLAACARRAHGRYFADMMRRLRPELTGSRRLDVLAALAADADNLRIAWRYWLAAEDMPPLETLAEGLLTLNEARGWYLATVGLATDMLALLSRRASASGQTDQEVALRTTLARVLLATQGYTPEVEEAFTRSIELFERGSGTHQRFTALRGLAYLYSLGGDTQKATRTGVELLELAERENDPAMLIESNLRLGASKTFVNDLRGGLEHLDRAISLFASVPQHAFDSRPGGNDPRVACYTTSGFALWLLGRPDQAVVRANAALCLAAELDHPFTLAYASFHAGLLHLWRRDYDAVVDLAAGSQDIAREHGFQVWQAAGAALLGAAQAGLGRKTEGMASLRSGMHLYQGLRSPPVFWPILLSVQAAACLSAGERDEGLRAADSALEIMQAGDGTTLLPELQLLKGDLLLAASDGGQALEAERWYRTGFERAQELGARMSQLRAATRLCRSAKDDAAIASTRRVLAEILGTFTEGWTACDLIEARQIVQAAATGHGHPEENEKDRKVDDD